MKKVLTLALTLIYRKQRWQLISRFAEIEWKHSICIILIMRRAKTIQTCDAFVCLWESEIEKCMPESACAGITIYSCSVAFLWGCGGTGAEKNFASLIWLHTSGSPGPSSSSSPPLSKYFQKTFFSHKWDRFDYCLGRTHVMSKFLVHKLIELWTHWRQSANILATIV